MAAWSLNCGSLPYLCDVPSPNTGFVAIEAAENYALGLKSDGSIVAWGVEPTLPVPNSGFSAITCGMALKK